MRKLRVAQIGVLHEHSDGKMLTLRNRMQDVFEVVAIAAENQDAAQSWRPHAWELPCYAGLNRVGKEELFRMDLDAVFVETELHELVPTARILEDGTVSIHLLNNSADAVCAEIFCSGRKLKEVSLTGKELAEVLL
ncbi:MAG TPA: hypothetical protein DDZ11_09035 [Lentisphaeria bacterium]|nr:hypothetical protein [Lentisphaeria bacterium]